MPAIAYPPEVRLLFLQNLSLLGRVDKAAEATGIDKVTAYNWRKEDPNFAAGWEQAKKLAGEALEDEAWRRAAEGTLRPVYQGGERVGDVREYSDVLLIFLLKGIFPDKYREKPPERPRSVTNNTQINIKAIPKEELRLIHDVLRRARELEAGATGNAGNPD